MRSLLADLILVLHFGFVLFVVAGLVFTCVGGALRWHWVRNFAFRITHLCAIVFVVLESLAEVMCPLTLWEDALRGRNSELGFIARWTHRIMFYNFPESVFTAIYIAFAAVVAATWWLIPPHRRNRRSPKA